jgi:hypothetical protein
VDIVWAQEMRSYWTEFLGRTGTDVSASNSAR